MSIYPQRVGEGGGGGGGGGAKAIIGHRGSIVKKEKEKKCLNTSPGPKRKLTEFGGALPKLWEE